MCEAGSTFRQENSVKLFIAVLAVTALVGGDGEKSKSLPIRNAEADLFAWDPIKHADPVAWKDAVGRRVVAEGLAWGSHEKGLGERVLLDGSHIYVSGVNLPNEPGWPNGKLVRVVGTLRVRDMPKAGPGVQGYCESFCYFYLDDVKFRELRIVEWARLRLSLGKGDKVDLEEPVPR